MIHENLINKQKYLAHKEYLFAIYFLPIETLFHFQGKKKFFGSNSYMHLDVQYDDSQMSLYFFAEKGNKWKCNKNN